MQFSPIRSVVLQSEDLLVILDTSGALVVYSGTTKVGNLNTSTLDGFDGLLWNYLKALYTKFHLPNSDR